MDNYKKEVIDILFIKGTKVNRNLFNNLYYSYEKDSFAGFDSDTLTKNQKYTSYEILKYRHTDIAEKHNEYKFFIKLDDKKVFMRIVSDYNDITYDVMIYDMIDNQMYKKFDNIFFPTILEIQDSLKKLDKPILYINNSHINIVMNEGMFVNYLGYEDWDYKNKCQNMLDQSIIAENPLADFNGNDFIKIYEFKMNGLNRVKLKCDIKYKDGFYYIDKVTKIS